MLRARYKQRYSQNIQNCYNIFRIFLDIIILFLIYFRNKRFSKQKSKFI